MQQEQNISFARNEKLRKSKKKFKTLDKTKASQKTDIPTRIIKKNIDIFADILCTSIESEIKSSSFPSSLKLAGVTSVHKKGRKVMKQNFRSVSLLPTSVHVC